ncbi:hypothetical protein TRFO_39572 [Tritrichomonas foetus]|uniref:Calcineurin-like phosphoesterase domain-containing protein n=1 Tax=Tritrichomonas foetus TaxID=1144522 RepID=A0A1J4JAF5_9EUKA|nr:hypothetical protein TRFO_39572 [Tritrichomonas foetus]|eukprot:OHS94244.1 hypothetical protein TRFO_39572 [Tritrichomonas foetus]
MHSAGDEQFHYFIYAVSQFVWFLIALIIIVPFFFVKIKKKVGVIHSRTSDLYSWDPNDDPIVFGVLSDPHLTRYNDAPGKKLRHLLNYFQDIDVERVLIPGDLVDNWGSNTIFLHGKQVEDDFKEYEKIMNDYPDDWFIEAIGNHDEYLVGEYNSENHFSKKYFKFYKNITNDKWEDFIIKKTNYSKNGYNIEFYVLNLYQYPSPGARIGHRAYLTTEMLDIIEKVLSEDYKDDISTPALKHSHDSDVKNNQSCEIMNSLTSENKIIKNMKILISHYPIDFHNLAARSSTRKSFTDLISSHEIDIILTGHSHISLMNHHKGTLEKNMDDLVGSDGKFGLLTIDNGRVMIYEQKFTFSDEPKAVLTHPIPKNQISKETIFNEKETEIRVLLFSDNENATINVAGSIEGTLSFQRLIKPNISLYSMPLILNTSGTYKLSFSGDWNYNMEFNYGDSVDLPSETLNNQDYMFYALIASAILVWIIHLYIIFPLGITSKMKEAEEWVEGLHNCSNHNEMKQNSNNQSHCDHHTDEINDKIHNNINSMKQSEESSTISNVNKMIKNGDNFQIDKVSNQNDLTIDQNEKMNLSDSVSIDISTSLSSTNISQSNLNNSNSSANHISVNSNCDSFCSKDIKNSQDDESEFDEIQSEENDIKKYIIYIIFGFTLIKVRIHEAPTWYKWILAICWIAPIILPVSLLKIGSHTGVIFFLGYAIDHRFSYDLWGGIFSAFYVVSIYTPIVIVASTLSTQFFWKKAFIVEIVFLIILFFAIMILSSIFLYQATPTVYVITSPLYVFIPLLIIISLIFLYYHNRKKRRRIYPMYD